MFSHQGENGATLSSYNVVHEGPCDRPASENSVLHTVTIKIITLEILTIKI